MRIVGPGSIPGCTGVKMIDGGLASADTAQELTGGGTHSRRLLG
jgi:hypothetical protein